MNVEVQCAGLIYHVYLSVGILSTMPLYFYFGLRLDRNAAAGMNQVSPEKFTNTTTKEQREKRGINVKPGKSQPPTPRPMCLLYKGLLSPGEP